MRAVSWDDAPVEVDGADAVVNLAGVSIGGPRWTARRKESIRASRVGSNRALAEAISAAKRRPRVFATASGIDFYGDRGDESIDETSPAGRSFLAGVCLAWEAAAESPARHVAVRTALVIGPGAQAVRLMALPFKLFVGGPLGNGRQWFSWIHLDDLVRVYRLAIEDDSLAGPVNAVAPEQLRQREAARTFGRVLHRPALLPTPAFVLRAALGEQADLLLHGRRAASNVLEGFDFGYSTLESALREAFG